MPQADSLAEVAHAENLGVKFRLNTGISTAVSMAEEDAEWVQQGGASSGVYLMFNEILGKHDAIFVGVGLGGTRSLDIGGINLWSG
ncbi:MAG TPA: hypothetical protein VMM38_00015 [Aridibacter sp.]|nr:hypothetical protein [Aridibacter sp.]